MTAINLKAKIITLDKEISWNKLYSDMKDLWRNNRECIRYQFPIRGIHTTRYDIFDWSIRNAHYLNDGAWVSYLNGKEPFKFANFKFVGDWGEVTKKVTTDGQHWMWTKRNWMNVRITDSDVKFIFENKDGHKGYYQVHKPVMIGSHIIPVYIDKWVDLSTEPIEDYLDSDLFKI